MPVILDHILLTSSDTYAVEARTIGNGRGKRFRTKQNIFNIYKSNTEFFLKNVFIRYDYTFFLLINFSYKCEMYFLKFLVCIV